MDSGAKYYYDINNFIVTSGVDLEQFGILPPKSVPTGVKTTTCGSRTYPDTPAPVLAPPILAPSSTQSPETTFPFVLEATQSMIPTTTTFCSECGLRISRHMSRKVTWNNQKVYMLYCDPEVHQA